MDKYITEEEDNGGINTTGVNIPIWNQEGRPMEIYLHPGQEIFKETVVEGLDTVAMKTSSIARFKFLEE